jgi:hypothetical protein
LWLSQCQRKLTQRVGIFRYIWGTPTTKFFGNLNTLKAKRGTRLLVFKPISTGTGPVGIFWWNAFRVSTFIGNRTRAIYASLSRSRFSFDGCRAGPRCERYSDLESKRAAVEMIRRPLNREFTHETDEPGTDSRVF